MGLNGTASKAWEHSWVLMSALLKGSVEAPVSESRCLSVTMGLIVL